MKSSLKMQMRPKSETEGDPNSIFSSIKQFNERPSQLLLTSINKSKNFDGSSMIVWNNTNKIPKKSSEPKGRHYNLRKISNS